MRWIATRARGPRVGDSRIRRRFLLIPRCINGEWRWMERAAWRETYRSYWDSSLWEKDWWINPEAEAPLNPEQ